MTDPPVGIRPEINSHTPREKLFRVRLSPSPPLALSRPRVRLFPIPACFAPHLLSFFPASRRVSLTLPIPPDRLLMVPYRLGAHNQARERRSPAIGSPARSCLHRSCIALAYSRAARNRLDCKSRTLDPAAWISNVRTLIRSEGNTRKGETISGVSFLHYSIRYSTFSDN